VDRLLPAGPHGYIGFWLGVSGLSFLTILSFTADAIWISRSRASVLGAVALILLEGAIFAGPTTPRVSPEDVPPQSPSLIWLRRHAGSAYVAALGSTMPPESATLYGLRDIRGYEAGLMNTRTRALWSLAEPGAPGPALDTAPLVRPRVSWLSAVGVRFILSSPADRLPGSTAVYRKGSVTISSVGHARPFVSPVLHPHTTVTEGAALHYLSTHLSSVVIETRCCLPAGDSSARVGRLTRDTNSVEFTVQARRPTALLVLQTYTSDWKAQIDGHATDTYPGDLAFTAVVVPAGAHRVSLRYEPASIWVGGALSLGGLLGIVAMILATRCHAVLRDVRTSASRPGIGSVESDSKR
jgi:hypothetical protein